ncbi:uncharacterized protein LOC115243176 isoform X2 [Formica exsecta]|uniref:uncharacterized protein LOC115243176 isoform X2 n=1 Tax=Formica exsecta TaxID=72781 RepID=UPI0011449FB9|nr:uncharacterized protein LOC115243176 isoform X2 [Formica exsecta]
MDEFSQDMQKLLLKKEREYGQLKFVSSRATKETSCFIDELVQAVVDIIQKYNLFPEDNNPKEARNITLTAAQCYNYLLLNTNFPSQHLLQEDLLYGHLVGLWPTLSPYLFIQIIWRLKCECILVESLMYIPLDLFVEILEELIKYVNELEISRAKCLILVLNNRTYEKCLRLNLGTLSEKDITERACQLVASFQALLDLLGSPRFTGSPELSEEARYEQHGFLLKCIFRHIKLCMSKKIEAYTENIYLEKLFKLTYGNLAHNRINYYCTLPVDKVKSIVATLDQELITLLLNQIKQVDCYEYMGWLEINDTENIMISLQRAIVIECHYFINFMKENEFLGKNDHLLHCLQQLIGSKNSKESLLTLQELCHSIANGKPEGMRELMKRYKEWDKSILSFINEKIELLQKDDCCILLEYLHHMFAYPHTEVEKYQAYVLVLRVIVQQNIQDVYYIIIKYVLRHFDDNRLEYLYNHKLFITFMQRNMCLRESEGLLILLIFVLLNAKKVLTTLVEIAIGCNKYESIIFMSKDILLLRSFLIIQKDNEYNLLMYILKDVCLQKDVTWSCKRFPIFVDTILDHKLITPDDLINIVYIPYLIDSSFHYFNFLCILMHMYDIVEKRVCIPKVDYPLLIIALTKKMSLIRKSEPTCLRSTIHDLIGHITRILNALFYTPNILTVNQQREVIDAIDDCVEPIDRARLSPLWHILNGSVLDIIQDYERRCFFLHRRLRTDPRCEPKLREYAQSFRLDRESFLRHMILHATEKEYEIFAVELTTIFWCNFGWTDEMEAYENMLRITGEAAQLALAFYKTFPNDTFVSLIRILVNFCDVFAHINRNTNDQQVAIRRILLKTLRSLKDSTNRTYLGQMYGLLLARIEDTLIKNSYSYIKHYFHEVDDWIDVYLVQCEGLMTPIQESENSNDSGSSNDEASLKDTQVLQEARKLTSKEIDMFNSYRFVCECIKISNRGTHRCVERIRDVILTKKKV